MVTDSRDNYRRSQNEYQRPAGQFTQRDDIREYMGGGAGQNFSAMQDIQQQLPNMQANDPRVQEFKDRRRHFNRYDKNGYGEVFNKSPLEMQDMYQGMSRDVRQTNKPVYNKMYPITGGFMDYMDQGGIYGMAARGILGGLKKDVTGMGKDILNNVGIGGAVDSDEEELETFSERTFGIGSPTFPGSEMTIPYPQEGFPKPDNTVTIEDTFTEPTQPYFQDDDYLAREAELQRLVEEEQRRIDNFGTNAYSDILDDAIENQWPNNIEPPLQEEVVVPEEPLPFNDNLREAGIASMMGQGPQFGMTNRRYENEYKDYISSAGDMPGGPVTYEEFAQAYERMYQGKPQIGFR